MSCTGWNIKRTLIIRLLSSCFPDPVGLTGSRKIAKLPHLHAHTSSLALWCLAQLRKIKEALWWWWGGVQTKVTLALRGELLQRFSKRRAKSVPAAPSPPVVSAAPLLPGRTAEVSTVRPRPSHCSPTGFSGNLLLRRRRRYTSLWSRETLRRPHSLFQIHPVGYYAHGWNARTWNVETYHQWRVCDWCGAAPSSARRLPENKLFALDFYLQPKEFCLHSFPRSRVKLSIVSTEEHDSPTICARKCHARSHVYQIGWNAGRTAVWRVYWWRQNNFNTS